MGEPQHKILVAVIEGLRDGQEYGAYELSRKIKGRYVSVRNCLDRLSQNNESYIWYTVYNIKNKKYRLSPSALRILETKENQNEINVEEFFSEKKTRSILFNRWLKNTLNPKKNRKQALRYIYDRKKELKKIHVEIYLKESLILSSDKTKVAATNYLYKKTKLLS